MYKDALGNDIILGDTYIYTHLTSCHGVFNYIVKSIICKALKIVYETKMVYVEAIHIGEGEYSPVLPGDIYKVELKGRLKYQTSSYLLVPIDLDKVKINWSERKRNKSEQ